VTAATVGEPSRISAARALAVGPSHNYYMGRAKSDITGFVDVFCRSMADALGAVRSRAAEATAGSGTVTTTRLCSGDSTRAGDGSLSSST
jgi:hypothetical protein